MACKDDGFCGFVGMQVVCEIFSIRSPTKLTHDVIFKELSTLKNTEKQLAYLFSLFDEVEVLHHNINICAIEKSNVVSNLLRQKGNIYYKNGDIKIALEYYSMSLSFAPEGSTEMAMAIGNKSACYFDLDHPWAVCSHIGIVEPMEMYPEKSWNKLKQRLKNVLTNFIPQYVPERIRQVCLYNYFNVTRWEWERSSSIISQPVLDFAGMSSETFTRVAAQLAQGVNPKVPGLSAAVKIEYNETLGRHLVAAKEIKPGDLVMRSNTSAPYLYAEKYEFSHCHYCLRFGHALVPCMDCPHERYCDMRCAELALNSYHWALCPVGGALNFGTHGAHAKLMLAIRLVVTHLSRHRGKMDEFLKEISKYDIERAENKIKGFNKKGVFDECDFRSVYYMWSDPSLLPEEERQSLLVDCAYAMQVITERSDLLLHEPSMVKSKKNEIRKELTSLLYHIRVGLEWNCFEMFDHLNYVSRKRTDKDKPFVVKSQVRSIGVYFNSLLGLFNHACYSNCVYSEQMNCITLVRALKKINVGEQLTIPYLDYWGTPKERRAALYRRMGGFQCGCFACSHDLDSKRVVKLRDLHLSPRCDRCKERKSARPDQDVVNCGKCKTTFSVDSVRSTLLRHIVMMHYYRVNLPIAEFPTMTAMFAFVEMIEEMALPHSCHELNRLRRAILNQIVAGDKCYVRPVMVCEPKRGLSLREELAAVPAHVWEDC